MIGRIECTHAERCGGCPLIELDYSEQLRKKEALARAAFEGYASLAASSFEPICAAETVTEYRVRAKLVVGADGAIGLYERGGHAVVDLPHCRVMRPSLARVADVLRRTIEPTSGLGAVDLREASSDEGDRVLVTLIVDDERDAHHELAATLMREAPEVAGVALSVRDQPTRVLGRAPKRIAGVWEIRDQVGGVEHFATPGAFVQAHRGQAAKLHAALRAAFERELGQLENARVIDVYGGSGAIGLALARAGAKVTLIESFGPAAEAARLAGLETRTGSADLLAQSGIEADAVVVNPPRRGVASAVRVAIAAAAPRVVAYVSCWPETLARDLDHFARLGYAVQSITPFDMIPLSDQVEALAILVRSPIPAPRVIVEAPGLVALERAAHCDLAGLEASIRARDGWQTARAAHRIDRDASGVVVFAIDSEIVAELTYQALARGVTRESGVVNRPGVRTRYRRRAVIGGHSLLEIETGTHKKQDLRRHLAGIGHPIVGDERFGHRPTNRHFAEKHGLDRCFLHLLRVKLTTRDGERTIEHPLPGELASVLRVLG